jgi:hypothetical protein
MAKPPSLLDGQQVAKALGVSLHTVDRLRREGFPTTWIVDVPRFELRSV